MNGDLTFKNGIKDGLPIGLGYLSVAFAFGVKASLLGVPIWLSFLISATNVTSAGQLAGLNVIVGSASFVEMILTQLVINARYSLMSLTLSQKIDGSFTIRHKLATSFVLTDEVFAVAVTKNQSVNKNYFYGLILLPYVCWSLGTLFGAIIGGILPSEIQTALGIAIYAMFIAIIIPPTITKKGVWLAVLLGGGISCLFYYVPLLSNAVSQGIAIIISALVGAVITALVFPISKGES